jgi:hypothetical protein
VSGTLLLLLVGGVIFDAWMTGLEIFLITDLFGEKFVCLFVTMRPAGTRVFANYIGTVLQSFNNNSFHTIRAPARFEPESTRDPTATHHLVLPDNCCAFARVTGPDAQWVKTSILVH